MREWEKRAAIAFAGLALLLPILLVTATAFGVKLSHDQLLAAAIAEGLFVLAFLLMLLPLATWRYGARMFLRVWTWAGRPYLQLPIAWTSKAPAMAHPEAPSVAETPAIAPPASSGPRRPGPEPRVVPYDKRDELRELVVQRCADIPLRQAEI